MFIHLLAAQVQEKVKSRLCKVQNQDFGSVLTISAF